MKLLFDQNLSFTLCQRLADLFPDSNQVRLLGLAEADARPLALCPRQWIHARVARLGLCRHGDAVRSSASSHLLRCGNQPTAHNEKLLRDHVNTIAAFEQDTAAACLEIY